MIYSRTPLIWINWDGETSGYAENTEKFIFLWKQATLAVCSSAVTTRVGNLIVASIYLQLIQNRYMFRGFTVLQCSHQHCVQPVASDVEVEGYL